MRRFTHQRSDWPAFRWREVELAQRLAEVWHRQGRLVGRMEGLGFSLRAEAQIEALTEEAVKSSAIEGERLDREQVRLSIARRLGVDIGGRSSTGWSSARTRTPPAGGLRGEADHVEVGSADAGIGGHRAPRHHGAGEPRDPRASGRRRPQHELHARRQLIRRLPRATGVRGACPNFQRIQDPAQSSAPSQPTTCRCRPLALRTSTASRPSLPLRRRAALRPSRLRAPAGSRSRAGWPGRGALRARGSPTRATPRRR